MQTISEEKSKRVIDLHHSLRSENFNRPQYQAALSLIENGVVGPARVIEFGGGRGEFSRLLRQKNLEVVFTDINPANVDHARQLGFEAFVCDANVPMDPSLGGTFDGVVMLEVIEHITNAELLLQEAHRLLKPGGFMVLSTPNPYFIWRRLSMLFGRPIEGEGYHYRFFTRQTLEQTLKDHKFKIVRHNHHTSKLGLAMIGRALGMRFNFVFPKFLQGLFVRKFYYWVVKT